MPNIDPRYSKRLEVIRQHVKNLWNANPGPPWYTFHDHSHNLAVEEKLYELIPGKKQKLLTDSEWFFLIAAAWLHDVGMMLKFADPNEPIRSIRENHHLRSADYVQKNRDVLGLDFQESLLIAEICKYHRKKLNILDCAEKTGNDRLRLLASYLRLADALHVDKTRAPEVMYQLLVAAGMPWESKFHWLKSFWIRSVIPEPELQKIEIHFIETDAVSARMDILAELVKNEVSEELYSVRDVLIRGKITEFLDVETQVVTVSGHKPLIELDLVLSNLEQESLSSASEVADSIVDTIIRLSKIGREAYSTIREYKEQLKQLLEVRSSHVIIQDLLSKLEKATEKEELDEDTKEKLVDQINAEFVSYKQRREKSNEELAANAKPFLSDEGSILLFGISSLVIKALNALPTQIKENTTIYVAEGRGKTQYNLRNELTYSDGIRYARKCREAGFLDVNIVPDISVANLMNNGLVRKVVFGANGIDPNGDFGHTAGHLGIAIIANRFNVPVYVIADSGKFGHIPQNSNLERMHPWLTRDSKSIEILKKANIQTLNPREDRVDGDSIDMLITDIGAFPPNSIPESLRK